MKVAVVAACLAVVTALARPPLAAAQNVTPPRWEVSGAYTYLRDPRTDLAFPAGWVAALAHRIGPIWITLETDRSTRTLPLLVGDARVTMRSLLGGARVRARVGPFREYAHILVGRAQVDGVFFGVEDGESRFAVQPGIGVEYPFGRRFAARLSLDARGIKSDNGSWVSQLRGSTGLTYSFR